MSALKAHCKNLREVRRNIDRIDKRMVGLLSERMHYVKHAMRFKRGIKRVRAPERESRVIQMVRLLAEKNRFGADAMESIYRVIIENFVKFEMEHFRKRAKKGEV